MVLILSPHHSSMSIPWLWIPYFYVFWRILKETDQTDPILCQNQSWKLSEKWNSTIRLEVSWICYLWNAHFRWTKNNFLAFWLTIFCLVKLEKIQFLHCSKLQKIAFLLPKKILNFWAEIIGTLFLPFRSTPRWNRRSSLGTIDEILNFPQKNWLCQKKCNMYTFIFPIYILFDTYLPTYLATT